MRRCCHRRNLLVESLESRCLLSVSASTLLGSLTPGSKLTYSISGNGVSGTSTITVKGPATFNGHNATETDSVSSNAPSDVAKSYFGLDASGNAVSYGSTGTDQLGAFTDTNTPPAIDFPATMTGGTTYTENWSTLEQLTGFTINSSTKHQVKLTSETLVSVTVPAGTFNAYLFDISDTITTSGIAGTPTSEQEWIAPNKGPVKIISGSGGTAVTEVLIPNNTVGPAAKLVFAQQPTTGKVGVAMSPAFKVDVTDANGNLVTGDTSTVTLSLFSGPAHGTLGGTLSAKAVGGVATFSNVTESVAGAIVVQAKDGTLTLAKSLPVTIGANITASKLAFAGPLAGGTVGKALPSVVIEVESSTGQLVIGDTSKVTITIASGPSGAALGGTTSVNALAGVATFTNLIPNKIGSYTLKASDGSLTSATSTSFNVTAAVVASKLVFIVEPHNGIAGKALSPSVSIGVETSSGTIVTTDTSKVTVTIASGPAGATLTGTASVNAVAGVATLNNLIFNKAGTTYTIKATDGSLASATSTIFTISAGAAAKLAFVQQPANTVAGKAIAPAVKVYVYDANNNLVSTNTSTVTMSIATGPTGSTLGGTVSVKAVGGIATFSNLILPKAGSDTLKAIDGSLASATSTSFKISAAAASKLVFTQQPTTAVHGSTLSAVKVSIEDTFGNVVLTNTSSVILALASGPSGEVLSGTLTEKAVAGVATFSNLKLSKAGTVVIKATSSPLATGSSKSIVVS
jgi:hypothetical protein